jgi:hypothetical protein
MSCAGNRDRRPRRPTQTHVRNRSDVLRRPARICAGLSSLADLASPVPEASCAALGGASLRFSLPAAARPSLDCARPVWATWPAAVACGCRPASLETYRIGARSLASPPPLGCDGASPPRPGQHKIDLPPAAARAQQSPLAQNREPGSQRRKSDMKNGKAPTLTERRSAAAISRFMGLCRTPGCKLFQGGHIFRRYSHQVRFVARIS